MEAKLCHVPLFCLNSVQDNEGLVDDDLDQGLGDDMLVMITTVQCV